MRKLTVIFSVLLLLSTAMFAQEGKAVKKGGVGPCLASCMIGPRVGLEMNEGKKIQTSEWIGFIVPPPYGKLYMAYDTGFKSNGPSGFVHSFCVGPRVGQELDTRKVRTKEWLQFCGVGRLLISLEAFGGKTMTEIEVAEGLRK